MTILVLAFIGLVLLALACGVVAMIYSTRDWRLDESAPARDIPLSPSGRPMASCADCGRLVAVRRRDGQPYAGRHRCLLPPSSAEVQ